MQAALYGSGRQYGTGSAEGAAGAARGIMGAAAVCEA